MNIVNMIGDFTEVRECEYKGEKYSVRDNGAIMRHAQEGKNIRPLDHQWTFGKPGKGNYLYISNNGVHRIVATAFHGTAPSAQHVVDHIDTNRHNNRPNNLRWLSKLENILNNEYTRSKIIFHCGSIEAFLDNPSMLSKYESDDPNFAWMKAVSKEEASCCKAHIERWTKEDNERKLSSGKSIGSWIYEKPKTQQDASPYEMSWDELKEHLDYHSEDASLEKQPIRREYPKVPAEGLPIYEKNQPRIIAFQDCLRKVCSAKGWDLQTNAAGKGWTADYMVVAGNKQVVFNNHIIPSKAKVIASRMKKQGIAVCWICNDEKQKTNEELPYFKYKDKEIFFSECYRIKVEKFISALVDGRLERKHELSVKYAYLYYWDRECYHCRKTMYAYGCKRFESSNGVSIDSYYAESFIKGSFSIWSPKIIEKVENYLALHPEMDAKFSIKPRYSNTRQEEYMSFGCHHCDAIYGSCYYDKDFANDDYDNDPSRLIKLDVEELGLVIEYNHWEIV